MRTIAIVNQKGGCGKTTTAINLGACLGRLHRRTLLIDLDPQGHCAAGLGVPEQQIDYDTNNFLNPSAMESSPAKPSFWEAAGGLSLLPSRVRLAGLEAPSSPFAKSPTREHSLADALAGIADDFDVCLLDCPPAIGLLTFNALVAADLVLVPVETAYFSLQGAARQLKTVRSVSRRLGSQIRCSVLPTLHEPGLAVADDLLDELKRQFGRRLLPVVVHRDAALREAASFGRPVCDHAPRSQAARDYAALASVLIETESLAPAPDDDWTDVDNATPTRRPGLDATHTDRPAQPADRQPFAAGTPGTMTMPQQMVSPFDADLAGQVVITVQDHHMRPTTVMHAESAPDHRPSPHAQPPALSNRAAELARRAAKPRASMLPAISEVPTRAGRPVFGVSVTDAGVELVQPGALGRSVAVAGTFSDWQPIDLLHDPASATHGIRLGLAPGRHEYRLIVDGTWTADPYNTEWTLSEFGEPHSLVEVPEPEHTTDDTIDMRSGAD